MLTIFSTAKPFIGHSDVIQRNALKSWTVLHSDVEVILLGDEQGAAEVCLELGIRHEPRVGRNGNGTKYLNDIFDRAYEYSRHSFLCYANCDIMLGSDFVSALEFVSKVHTRFLMIGRRWDTDISEPWDFTQPDSDGQLRSRAVLTGKQNGPSWIDYFCFSRDLFYKKMPPFLIGRHGWDPWLTYFARKCEVPLIDASRAIVAVHQNHDYKYLKTGAATEYSNAEVSYNWNLGDDSTWHHYTAGAATELLIRGCLKRNWLAWLGPIRSRVVSGFDRVWFSFLKATRTIRHPLGLRRKA
jgi:hypothetical protein